MNTRTVAVAATALAAALAGTLTLTACSPTGHHSDQAASTTGHWWITSTSGVPESAPPPPPDGRTPGAPEENNFTSDQVRSEARRSLCSGEPFDPLESQHRGMLDYRLPPGVDLTPLQESVRLRVSYDLGHPPWSEGLDVWDWWGGKTELAQANSPACHR